MFSSSAVNDSITQQIESNEDQELKFLLPHPDKEGETSKQFHSKQNLYKDGKDLVHKSMRNLLYQDIEELTLVKKMASSSAKNDFIPQQRESSEMSHDYQQLKALVPRAQRKPKIPDEYQSFPKHIFKNFKSNYLQLFKSTFIITFTIAFISRFNAIVDVVTDILQALEFWIGKERSVCDSSKFVMNVTRTGNLTNFSHNLTNSINMTFNAMTNSTHSLYKPRDPFWFSITTFSIFLPALICVMRYPTQTIKSQFLHHRFRLVCERQSKEEDISLKNSCVQKLGLFLILPILILIRQLRQLLLLIEIEYLDQTLSASLNEPSMLDRLKGFFSEHILKSCRRFVCLLSATERAEDGKRYAWEKKNEKLLVKAIHDALSNPEYAPPIRTKLTEQLILLSVDRQDEALVETTPQTVLNLMLMFRYGGDLLRQVSFCFSFYSLVSSSAAYTADKLKLNPVRRELNHFGKFLLFFAKFPATLSRCVLLSALFSIQNLIVKLGFTVFFIVYVMCGMLREYLSSEHQYGSMCRQLVQQVFLRGYTSLFTLTEYKLKGCGKDGKIIDEADIEAEQGKYEEPRSRYIEQIVYLITNSIINVAFAVWFYWFSGESICAIGIFKDYVGDVAFFWILVISVGSPVSLIFTVVMNFNMVQKYTTSMGLKATEALNYHIRTTIKKGNSNSIKLLVSMLKTLSKKERKRVAAVNDLTDSHSVIYHLLESLDTHTGLELLLEFRNMGFPLESDIGGQLYIILQYGVVEDTEKVWALLSFISEEEKVKVMDAMNSTQDSSVLYQILNCVFMNYLGNELFLNFREMGFPVESDLGAIAYMFLQRGVAADTQRVWELLDSIYGEEKFKIMDVMNSTQDFSVLYHILNCVFMNHLDNELFLKFREMGFPVEGDLGAIAYIFLQCGVADDTQRVWELLNSISGEERLKVMDVMSSRQDSSVLYHVLRLVFLNHCDYELFLNFREIGFPVEGDLGVLFYLFIQSGVTEKTQRVWEWLNRISDEERLKVMDVMNSTQDSSVLYHVLNCVFKNHCHYELFLSFHEIGFPVERDLGVLLYLFIQSRVTEKTQRVWEWLNSISDEERLKVIELMNSTQDSSVLYHVLNCVFVNHCDYELFLSFRDMGFPVESDLGTLAYIFVQHCVAEDTKKVWKWLNNISEEERLKVMDVMNSTQDPSVLYHVLSCVFMNHCDYDELFLSFRDMGFPLERDLGVLIYLFFQRGVAEDTQKLWESLNRMPGEDKLKVIDSILQSEVAEDTQIIWELLNTLFKGEMYKVMTCSVKSMNGASVLYYMLDCLFDNFDNELLLQFCDTTFPVPNSPIHERRTLSSMLENSAGSQFCTLTTSVGLPRIPLSLFLTPSDAQKRMFAWRNSLVKSDAGVIYIIGGENIDASAVIMYDIQSHTYTIHQTTGDVPCVRNLSNALVGEHIYVFGGWNREHKIANNLQKLNISTHVWTKVKQKGYVPPPRVGHISWCWRGEFWLFGGRNAKTGGSDNQTYKFNIDSNTWEVMNPSGTVPSPRWNVAHCVNGDTLYIYGGWIGSDCSNELFKLQMEPLAWSIIKTHGSLKLPQVSSAAICVHDNHLFLLGGQDGNAFLSKLYSVDLTTTEIEELLRLPSLITGEEKENTEDGVINHSMYTRSFDGNTRLVIVGGTWGSSYVDDPTKFVVECNVAYL